MTEIIMTNGYVLKTDLTQDELKSIFKKHLTDLVPVEVWENGGDIKKATYLINTNHISIIK